MERINHVWELSTGEYGLTKCNGNPECVIKISENNGQCVWYKIVRKFDERGIQFSELYKLNDSEALAYVM